MQIRFNEEALAQEIHDKIMSGLVEVTAKASARFKADLEKVMEETKGRFAKALKSR